MLMPQTRPVTFQEWLTLDKCTQPNEYVSVWPTESNGFDPRDKIGYGGCTMAFGINVGYASVGSECRLYSCMGHFLAAAIAGLPLVGVVQQIRDTRTFATRRIDIFQPKDDHRRHVMCMQLDFQIPEKATALIYSAPPHRTYTPVDQAWTELDMRKHAQQCGISEDILRTLDASMQARRKYFEVKAPPESYSADTLHGMLPNIGEVQKNKSITDKTTCYYWRCLGTLETPAANAAAVGFLMDTGMPVTAPCYAGLEVTKLAAVLSLDFAIRIFVNDLDASKWLTHEERTTTGGSGRTFSESRVWNQEGIMVAAMSEQCLLRPMRKNSTL